MSSDRVEIKDTPKRKSIELNAGEVLRISQAHQNTEYHRRAYEHVLEESSAILHRILKSHDVPEEDGSSPWRMDVDGDVVRLVQVESRDEQK